MTHDRLKILFSAFLHLLGVAVVFVLFSSVFISNTTALLIYNLMGDSQISEQIFTPIVITLGLSTVVYVTGVFMIRSLSRPRLETLKRARGTIMTETLIVLPIFLLLTSGLAQMGMNSMAGLLTTVGAFEAGRTVAVWGPEIGKNRVDGVDSAEVTERARLAVALVVTPVASTTLTAVNNCSETSNLKKILKGMVSAGMLPTPNLGAEVKIWSFSDAFGKKRFMQRGPAKLKSAFCAVDVSFDTVPNSGTHGVLFSTRVSYRHRAVFPMVSRIFGTSEIQRTYRMMSHIPPNDTLPY